MSDELEKLKIELRDEARHIRKLNARIAELEQVQATLANLNEELLDRIAELEAIVERLPKTADGVPITPGGVAESVIWGADLEKGIRVSKYCVDNLRVRDGRWWPNPCYSTREAAEAAHERDTNAK